MVRALASYQCVPGSIPGPGVICGLSLLLVLFSAPRGFPRVLRFSPLLKNQHFQIPILAWKVSPISAKALEDIDTKLLLLLSPEGTGPGILLVML